jgi:hypothetical protein
MSTGPIPDGITDELQALKRRLASMRGNDLGAAQAKAMSTEISAIRLHLQRLAFERQWPEDEDPAIRTP